MNEHLNGRMWLVTWLWLLGGCITLMDLSELQKHSGCTVVELLPSWTIFGLVHRLQRAHKPAAAKLLMLISNCWCLSRPLFILTSASDDKRLLKTVKLYCVKSSWWKYTSEFRPRIRCSTFHWESEFPDVICQWSLGHSRTLTAVTSISEPEWSLLSFQQWSMLQVWTTVLLLVHEITVSRCLRGQLELGRLGNRKEGRKEKEME